HDGSMFIGGEFRGTGDFDPGPDTFMLSSVGGRAGFLVKVRLETEVPVTVRVDDGRGGFDQQSFVIDLASDPQGEVVGTLFHDLNSDGLRNIASTLLVLESYDGGQMLRFNGSTGDFL